MSLRTKIPTRPSPHTTNYPITTGSSVPATTSGRNTQSFEELFPKQTGQLIKIGQDTTALGQIVTRQDVTDVDLQRQLNEAKQHRDSNAAKIEKLFSADQNIYSSISQKADKSHVHANGHSTDCGWFGEKCWLDGLGWVKWVALGAVALLVLWLIRPLLKIGANVTK